MSDKQFLMNCLEEAKRQLGVINREEDYALAASHAESEKEAEYWSECDRRQEEARKAVKKEISSLKQCLAELSEISETEKK